MKLYNMIDLVKHLAHNIPNVNTVIVGDVYDLNTIKDIEYSAIVITEQTHTINNADDLDTYNLNIFYVDRQTSDNTNVLDIHSHAIEVLKMLLNQVEESGVIISNEYQINTFKERFDSLCAGAFVNVELMTKSQMCGGFKLVTSVNGMVGDVVLNIKEPTSEIDYDDITTPTNSKAVVDYVEPINTKVNDAAADIHLIYDELSILSANKQDLLVSGANIKTVNGNSILGSGNITIDGGSNFIGKLGSYTTYLSGFLNALSVKGAVSNFDGISVEAAQVGDIFIIEAKAADTHDYYIFVMECETPTQGKLRGHTIYSYITHDYELLSNKVTEITSASTNTQYPSAKAVYDITNTISGEVNTIKSGKQDILRLYYEKYGNNSIVEIGNYDTGQIILQNKSLYTTEITRINLNADTFVNGGKVINESYITRFVEDYYDKANNKADTNLLDVTNFTRLQDKKLYTFGWKVANTDAIENKEYYCVLLYQEDNQITPKIVDYSGNKINIKTHPNQNIIFNFGGITVPKPKNSLEWLGFALIEDKVVGDYYPNISLSQYPNMRAQLITNTPNNKCYVVSNGISHTDWASNYYIKYVNTVLQDIAEITEDIAEIKERLNNIGA